MVDHFTRYIQAFVTNNHTAFTTAQVLYNNFFSVFGFPQRLMSDKGTEFTGNVIATMCKLLGIEKIRTTPYHPQGNGLAERVHQTLQRMIGKLDPEKCRKWPEHIGVCPHFPWGNGEPYAQKHTPCMSCAFLAAARKWIQARITGYTFSILWSGITGIGFTGDFLRANVPGLFPFCASRHPCATVNALLRQQCT